MKKIQLESWNKMQQEDFMGASMTSKAINYLCKLVFFPIPRRYIGLGRIAHFLGHSCIKVIPESAV
jgi:hypothetical protein